jgi:hypothetical protein
MSKCATVFASLMQSLSRHLRPAPYPYGLLTLRLLGKLGGKNRIFLRDPIQQNVLRTCETKLHVSVPYTTDRMDDTMDESDDVLEVKLPLPLRSCVEMLRELALASSVFDMSDPASDKEERNVLPPIDLASLWECKIEDLDIQSYSAFVIKTTRQDQAEASMNILRAAMDVMNLKNLSRCMDVELNTHDSSNEIMVCNGLLYACMVDATKDEALCLICDHLLIFDRKVFSGCFASFMSEPSQLATKVGLTILDFALCKDEESDKSNVSLLFDALICSLCETACASSWGRYFGLMRAIEKMAETLGCEWSRKYEVNLVNATLLAIKSQPRELSEVSVRALSGFIRVCHILYGKWYDGATDDDSFIWDELSVEGCSSKRGPNSDVNSIKYRPSEDVFKIIIYEITSSRHIVR